MISDKRNALAWKYKEQYTKYLA